MVPGQLLPGSGRGARPLPKEPGQAPEVIRLWETGKLRLSKTPLTRSSKGGVSGFRSGYVQILSHVSLRLLPTLRIGIEGPRVGNYRPRIRRR